MASGEVAVVNEYKRDRDSGYGSERGFENVQEHKTKASGPSREEMPRAASYTDLPRIKDSTFDIVPLKGSFNAEGRADSDMSEIVDNEQFYSSGGTSPESETDTMLDNEASQSQEESARKVEDATSCISNHKTDTSVVLKASESGKKLRRRTWLTGSRSASPAKENAGERHVVDSAPASPLKSPWPRERRMSLRRRDSKSTEKGKQSEKEDKKSFDGVQRPGLERKGTFKKASRPLSLLLSGSSDKNGSCPPPIPSLPKSFSTDRLPTLKTPSPGIERVPPIPRTISSEKLLKAELGRKKDELWSVFRTLDGEYQK